MPDLRDGPTGHDPFDLRPASSSNATRNVVVGVALVVVVASAGVGLYRWIGNKASQEPALRDAGPAVVPPVEPARSPDAATPLLLPKPTSPKRNLPTVTREPANQEPANYNSTKHEAINKRELMLVHQAKVGETLSKPYPQIGNAWVGNVACEEFGKVEGTWNCTDAKIEVNWKVAHDELGMVVPPILEGVRYCDHSPSLDVQEDQKVGGARVWCQRTK